MGLKLCVVLKLVVRPAGSQASCSYLQLFADEPEEPIRSMYQVTPFDDLLCT